MAWVEFLVWITTESTPSTRCFYAERCVQAALLGVPEATQQRRSQVFGDRWWFHFLALEPRTVTCVTRKSMEIRDACTHGQPKWIGFGRGLFEVKMRMFLALVLLFRHQKYGKTQLETGYHPSHIIPLYGGDWVGKMCCKAPGRKYAKSCKINFEKSKNEKSKNKKSKTEKVSLWISKSWKVEK